MERQTFERALHLWPDWHESVSRARLELGYDPKWPTQEAVSWIERNYPEKIRPRAEAELEKLGLPPNLFQYREDCFYCDYRRPDGSSNFDSIKRRLAYEETDRDGKATGRWLPGVRSLPELPYEVSVVYYPGEDIHNPWVHIELTVHASFVRRDNLFDAFGTALKLTRHLETTGRVGEVRHPVSALVARAKPNRSDRKRSAVERYKRGEIDLEGLLEEEWYRPEAQSDIALNVQHRNRSWSIDKAIRSEQDKLYNRVRGWLPDPKPKLGRNSAWRDRLQLPSDTKTP